MKQRKINSFTSMKHNQRLKQFPQAQPQKKPTRKLVQHEKKAQLTLLS
jgi:hypothetical protein